jgi:hypothetical protein
LQQQMRQQTLGNCKEWHMTGSSSHSSSTQQCFLKQRTNGFVHQHVVPARKGNENAMSEQANKKAADWVQLWTACSMCERQQWRAVTPAGLCIAVQSHLCGNVALRKWKNLQFIVLQEAAKGRKGGGV